MLHTISAPEMFNKRTEAVFCHLLLKASTSKIHLFLFLLTQFLPQISEALSTVPFYAGSVVIIIVRGCPQAWRRVHSLWTCFLPFGSAQVQWERRFVPPCWRDARALCTPSSPTSQWWSTLTRWTFLMGWTGRWITKPSSTLTACPTRWMLLIMTSKLEKLVWVVVFQNNCLCLKIVMFVSTLVITQMIRALGALIQKPL